MNAATLPCASGNCGWQRLAPTSTSCRCACFLREGQAIRTYHSFVIGGDDPQRPAPRHRRMPAATSRPRHGTREKLARARSWANFYTSLCHSRMIWQRACWDWLLKQQRLSEALAAPVAWLATDRQASDAVGLGWSTHPFARFDGDALRQNGIICLPLRQGINGCSPCVTSLSGRGRRCIWRMLTTSLLEFATRRRLPVRFRARLSSALSQAYGRPSKSSRQANLPVADDLMMKLQQRSMLPALVRRDRGWLSQIYASGGS